MSDPAATTAEVLDEIHTRYGTKGLERVEAALRFHDSGEIPQLQPFQHSQALYVPGLTGKPWHDPKDFAWWTPFEEATADVLRELEIVEKANVGFSDWSGYGHGWTGRMFYSQGKW